MIFPARTVSIYLVDVDGSNLSRLVDLPLGYTTGLLWLPAEAGW